MANTERLAGGWMRSTGMGEGLALEGLPNPVAGMERSQRMPKDGRAGGKANMDLPC